MKGYINTFVEYDFLEYLFVKEIPKISFQDLVTSDKNRLRTWNSLFDLIYSNSYLKIDDKVKVLNNAKENPLFMKLIDSVNTGGSKLKQETFDNKFTTNLATDTLLCFSANQNYCSCFLSLDSDNYLENINKISLNKTIIINKDKRLNQFNGWNFINEISLPINSAIISDRYFIKYLSSFEENLFKIIDALVSCNNSDLPFHLTIISQKDSNIKTSDYINKINNYIKNKFKNLKLELTLFLLKNNECPHDRNIITNYFLINSDNSFDFYNRNGQIQTNTVIKISGINIDTQNYFSLLHQYKFIFQNKKGFGSNINRMINNFNQF